MNSLGQVSHNEIEPGVLKTAGATASAWTINAGFCQYVIGTKI